MEEKHPELVYNVREIASIRELVEDSCEMYADNIAFLFHDKEGKEITEISYSRTGKDVRYFATYLCSLGLHEKKVAVIGRNSYPWALTYLAVCCGVGVIVPLDRDLHGDQIADLLRDAGAAAIVYDTDKAAQMEQVSFDGVKISFEDVPDCIAKGRDLCRAGDCSYEKNIPDPYALGVLLYTSGTTGISKGVMLSQHNICSDIVNVCRQIHVYQSDRCLSILPLHHTFECMAGFLTFLYSGASIAYNASLRTLMQDLKLFRPTGLIAVPLVLETFYHAILKKYKKLRGGDFVLKTQMALARATGSYAARRRIFGAVHEAMGGRLRIFLIGAAPVRPEVCNAFELFGYPVYIGYGLTETSPVCLVHNDRYRRPDDVGYPIAGLRAKIVDSDEEGVGELAVKGPNVMLGYYHDPQATAQVMHDGWFYTGDLAKKKPNGAYQICGRIKSMIVLKNGKKVFPEELEQFLGQAPCVEECMVYGEEENDTCVLTAVVYPNESYLQAAAALLRQDASQPEEEQTSANMLHDQLMQAVQRVNERFPAYKSIRRVKIRTEPFVMTSTRKIKRNLPENRMGEELS